MVPTIPVDWPAYYAGSIAIHPLLPLTPIALCFRLRQQTPQLLHRAGLHAHAVDTHLATQRRDDVAGLIYTTHGYDECY